VLLSNSLGTSFEMWDEQLPALSQRFRVLRYDHRGHGKSPTPDGSWSIETLGTDVLALLDHYDLARVNVVGLSLGAMVGMWLASHHGERVDRLVLCCTAPWLPSEEFLSRAAQVRAAGTASLTQAILERWFTPGLRATRPEILQRFAGMLAATSDEGYAKCCEAIAEMDLRPDLARIKAPTLLVFGAGDPGTTPAIGESLRAAIGDAGLVVIPRAAHLANVEQSEAVTNALMTHLCGDLMERGLAARRSVLGPEYVERAFASATELTRPFQEILTRFAWGEVWSRPAMPVETRRLITIAVLAGAGRRDELELHIRAALAGGLDPELLRETLLQTAVYAGIPAANTAFAIAQRVMSELELASS